MLNKSPMFSGQCFRVAPILFASVAGNGLNGPITKLPKTIAEVSMANCNGTIPFIELFLL